MKPFLSLTTILLLTINSLYSQANRQALPPPLDTSDYSEPWRINPEKFYLDAGGGYFPESGNASWAGQLSAGYRLTPKIAVGVGTAYWGRVNTFERSALGIGIQYRHQFWNVIVKAELGYLLKPSMYDHKLDRKMDYIATTSTPPYYKLDINWRIWHYMTLGISACQTNNLSFRRQINESLSSTDNWRINALTVQLGIALNTPD
jgi:hypothetical protein